MQRMPDVYAKEKTEEEEYMHNQHHRRNDWNDWNDLSTFEMELLYLLMDRE